jgi:hypothetical protein
VFSPLDRWVPLVNIVVACDIMEKIPPRLPLEFSSRWIAYSPGVGGTNNSRWGNTVVGGNPGTVNHYRFVSLGGRIAPRSPA